MIFYASKCHDRLSGREFTPEAHHGHICVSPHYPARIVRPDIDILLDSGAFQDVADDTRLSYADALDRQLAYEYDLTPDHRPVGAIVSYDRLVDEQLGDDGQFKARVDYGTSLDYIEDTINAARYLAGQRDRLRPRKLILSCQGTTTEQYIGCAAKVLEVARPGDIIGIGGFCIISKSKAYEVQFYEVISRLFPMMATAGIDRAHIFGVGILRVLIQAEIEARRYGIKLSYDTSSYEVNAVFGRVFDPIKGQLTGAYTKDQKRRDYWPARLAEFNIRQVAQWWADFDAMMASMEVDG